MLEKLKDLTFGRAVLISLVLAALYYFSLYDSGAALETQIKSTTSEIEKNKAELASVKQALDDAKRFETAKTELGAEMDRVMRAIPAKLTPTELMRIISNEAKGVGAQINGITAPQPFRTAAPVAVKGKDAPPPPIYEPIDIDIDITGTYNQIMLFFSNLTRLDKIITVRKMVFSVVGSATTNPTKNSTASVVPTINLKAGLSAHKSVEPPAPAEKPKTPPDPGAKPADGKGGAA